MNIIDEALVGIKNGRDTHYIEQLGSDTYVSVNNGSCDPFDIGGGIKNSRGVYKKRVFYLDSLQWSLLTRCSKDIERAIPRDETY
jgi:hypothetical protein